MGIIYGKIITITLRFFIWDANFITFSVPWMFIFDASSRGSLNLIVAAQ